MQKARWYLFIVLFIFSANVSVGQPVHLLHQSYAVKYHYLDSMWRLLSPEGKFDLFTMMNDMAKWAEKNNDKEFSIQLRLSALKWLSYQRHNIDVESRIAKIIPECTAVSEFLEADAIEMLACYQYALGKFPQAFENYLLAYSLFSNFSARDFCPKQEYLYNTSNIYFRYGDYDNSLRYLVEALQTQPYNNDFIYPIYNSLGMCYRMNSNYDSSDKYFRMIYEDAIRKDDKTWIGIAGGNIGINYFRQRRYDEAMPLLEKDIELSIATGSLKNAAGTMNTLSEIYYIKGQYDKAEQLTLRALSLVSAKTFWPDYRLAEAFYTELFKVYNAKKDFSKAAIYADSAMTASDSVASQYNTLNIQKAKEKLEIVQRKMQEQELNNQKDRQVLIRNGLVAAIVLLTIIAIMFISRQRLKQKKLEAEKKNAEYDLEMATSQLENFKLNIQEKNSLVEQFASEIEQYKMHEKSDADDEILLKLQQSSILTDEQWENFRVLFEKVHKGFFKRVKDKMPDLTPGEIRFVALSKLKLSPKEMGTILGISSSTIRNYRLRLRRKLDLDEDASIEEIADAI